jgi:signal transduction histidine kinase
LRLKVTAGVLLALLVILSILSYVRYVTYERLLLGNLHAAAQNAGEIVESSLQHAMFTNDFSMLGHIVRDIGNQPDVRALYLLSKSGEVLLSTDDEAVGKVLNIAEPTCQHCHQPGTVSRNESVVLSLDSGKVFRNVNAVENAIECTGCHDDYVTTLGVLIADFDMTSIEHTLSTDRRNNLLWLVGSATLVAATVYLLMDRMVIARIRQLAGVIKQVGAGNLSLRVMDQHRDEIGELAGVLNQMTDGLKGKAQLEHDLRVQTKELQAHARRLAILNALANAMSQSLDLGETLDSAQDQVLELLNLRASWVVLTQESDETFELVTSRGLPEEIAAPREQCMWSRCVCTEVLEHGEIRVFEDLSTHFCPMFEHLSDQGLVFRACVPLVAKDRVLGVMSLLGDASSAPLALEDGTLDMLLAIGRQIGIAIENASLYQELREEETLRRHLLERVMAAQEDERKRIALELHDQTGQPLTSLIITLGVLAEATSLTEVKTHVPELRAMASQILQDVHDLALELRPSVLDDLGLLPALRHLHKEYQDRFRLPVDLQVLGLDGERLPSEMETALYRIVQEALTNVARHADAHSVSVLLEKRSVSVKLIVEDDGHGFDIVSTMSTHSRDRLGLYGMRERASLLGGTLTIESSGKGTAIFVEIPLKVKRNGNGQDPPADR